MLPGEGAHHNANQPGLDGLPGQKPGS